MLDPLEIVQSLKIKFINVPETWKLLYNIKYYLEEPKDYYRYVEHRKSCEDCNDGGSQEYQNDSNQTDN